MKKVDLNKKVFISAFLFLVIFWLFSIVKCEINTYLHGSQFVGEYEQTNMIGGNPKTKVLKYSEEYAEIYYVNDEGGDIITFEKINEKWIMKEWKDTVWSATGSADGFMWPYGR